MKVLLVADRERRELWDYWDTVGKKKTEGVRLILSAGDLRPEYLEFLVTMLNVPCLYVRGNHDGWYDDKPPEGCLNIDDRICEITFDDADVIVDTCKESMSTTSKSMRTTSTRTIRIAGLGGSMRYNDGQDMYTEHEMTRRVRKILRRMRLGMVTNDDGRPRFSLDMSAKTRSQDSGAVDILLTHAPSRGNGDMEDQAHRGFDCFNDLIEEIGPTYHCFGHVHPEYNGMMRRESDHPAGTHLINVCGMYILDI
jgi:Icc-related predicted phosphoesterase